MLGAIVEAIKSVIDLRKKAREDKKTGLEIQRIERELVDKDRLVRPATFEEVEKYDPRIETIRAQFQPRPFQSAKTLSPPPAKESPFAIYAWLIVIGCFLIYWLVKVYRFLLH